MKTMYFLPSESMDQSFNYYIGKCQPDRQYINKTAPKYDLSCSVSPGFSQKIMIKALWKFPFLGAIEGHCSQCSANKNASPLFLVPHVFCKQEIKLLSLSLN